MKINALRRLVVIAAALGSLNLATPAQSEVIGFPGGANDALGPQFDTQTQFLTNPQIVTVTTGRVASTPATYLRNWNRIALDATGLDHTPVAPGSTRIFGEQLGPTRASRAMAIVHIAMFDALNAIDNRYESYTGLAPVNAPTSRRAAIAQAGHDSLVALFPSQASTFDTQLKLDLDQLPNSKQKTRGTDLGKKSASAILFLRSNDQSAIAEPVLGVDYITKIDPGFWRQDPISLVPIALGAHWSEVRPFVMTSASQFRLPPPPALNSAEYTAAYNDVKAIGGDGITTPTTRTQDQTEAGIFWAYDGTPSLCAPPRLYNQLAIKISTQKKTNNALNLARLLTLVNVSLADAGISSWDSKYFYEYWRPIGGIREGDTDGNNQTAPDVTFTPLGGQATNLTGPNFTPPFPSYPSGHATFGGALFQSLRNFYGTDKIPFTFVSDEFNGVNKDSQGNVRPLKPRSFDNLSQAEEENGQSRIYLGIHWVFDKTSGITQGNNVANYIFGHALAPLNPNSPDNLINTDTDI
ncbi:MAG: hypothetical protein WC782_10470 [Methylococcaceae bacterium]